MIKHQVFFFAGSEVCGEGRVKRPERDRAFLAWFFFPLEKEVELLLSLPPQNSLFLFLLHLYPLRLSVYHLQPWPPLFSSSA